MASRKGSANISGKDRHASNIRQAYAADTKSGGDLPPPTYEEATAKNPKYGKDEYPSDEKDSEDESNPFPVAYVPRRSKTMRTPASQSRSTKTRANEGGNRKPVHADAPTADERTRSKSVSESSRHHKHHHHRHHSSSRRKVVAARSKNMDTIDRLDVTGFFAGGGFHHDGPFDACTPHRNKDAKAAPVLAFPADGPNNSMKGMGSGPVHSKEDQYDLVFGLSEEDPLYTSKVSRSHSVRRPAPVQQGPSTGTSSSQGTSGSARPQQQQQQQPQHHQSQSHQDQQQHHHHQQVQQAPQLLLQKQRAQKSSEPSQSAPRKPSARNLDEQSLQFFSNNRVAYGNGVVLQKARDNSSSQLDDLHNNPAATRYDVNTKAPPVHGDTTLGLGSSTFMDGAPASTKAQQKAKAKEQKMELGRKKSIMDSNGFLRRVKSLKVRKSSVA